MRRLHRWLVNHRFIYVPCDCTCGCDNRADGIWRGYDGSYHIGRCGYCHWAH